MILMDHMMPKMDGIETMKQIRRLAGNQNPMAPIIVLTANATAGSQKQYIEEGFDDYLAKPVQSEKLEQMIFEYLPKRMIQKGIWKSQNARNRGMMKKSAKSCLFMGLMYRQAYAISIRIWSSISVLQRHFTACKRKRAKAEEFFRSRRLKRLYHRSTFPKKQRQTVGDEPLGSMAEELEMAGVRGELDVIREKMRY